MVYLSGQIFREEPSTFPNFFNLNQVLYIYLKMSTIFMLGVTAGTILTTQSIPYKLLGLNGVFLMIDAFLNSPYTAIAKYSTLLGIGSYYILKDNAAFHYFAKLVHRTMEKQMGIEQDSIEETTDEVEENEDEEHKENVKEVEETVPPLPSSPPDTEKEKLSSGENTDDEMPPLIPIPDDTVLIPEDTTIPELYVPLYEINKEE